LTTILLFLRVSGVWWINLNIFRFPVIFIFIDKRIIFLYLITSLLVVKILWKSNILSKIFFIEDLVILRKNAVVKLKFADIFLVKINNTIFSVLVIVSFKTLQISNFLKFSVISLVVILLLGVL
jgi:hypothetical protein